MLLLDQLQNMLPVRNFLPVVVTTSARGPSLSCTTLYNAAHSILDTHKTQNTQVHAVHTLLTVLPTVFTASYAAQPYYKWYCASQSSQSIQQHSRTTSETDGQVSLGVMTHRLTLYCAAAHMIATVWQGDAKQTHHCDQVLTAHISRKGGAATAVGQ
jgi:hypothetical protein